MDPNITTTSTNATDASPLLQKDQLYSLPPQTQTNSTVYAGQ
jgi:hypothetical protein